MKEVKIYSILSIFLTILTFLFKLIIKNGTLSFIGAILSIVPLAALMGIATEELSISIGQIAGGFLNATFGNAAELIIAIISLKEGLQEIVKASITGSIIGNNLFVLGMSLLFGGMKFKKQTFNRVNASLSSTLSFLAVIGLIIPTIFHYFIKIGTKIEEDLSVEISFILFFTYLFSLLFTFVTHKHIFKRSFTEEKEPELSKKLAILILLLTVIFLTLMAEVMVKEIEEISIKWNLNHTFIGVVIIAIIGNAAEHSSAVLMALKNKMDTSLSISVGSSLQIALFVAPILVFLSLIFGWNMNLVFTPLEVVILFLSSISVYMVSSDGESNWMEGLLLMAIYLIFAFAFFYIT